MSLFMSWLVNCVAIIALITIVAQIIGRIFIKDIRDDNEPQPNLLH